MGAWLVVLSAWVFLFAIGLLPVALWWGRFSPRARMRRRLDGIVGRLADGSAPSEAVLRRHMIQGKLKELERQRQTDRGNQFHRLIVQSGLKLTVRDYILICFGCAGSIGGALWLLGMPLLICGSAALAGGLALPRFVLLALAKRRRKQFVMHFADALDIMVRGTRSGLPIGECLRIVAREAPDPVGAEFRFLTESERIGVTLKQALGRSLERMLVAELQFFAVVLLIQQEAGGNLAGTLENLSNILRARKRIRDKVIALSSEARASAAIIGSLPFAVGTLLTLINPTYMDVLFSTRVGNYLIAAALVWMTIGVIVMRQMIDFEAS